MVGLGDSSYEKFNFTAKKLLKRFAQLGATPLCDLCLCDEQHSGGIEGAFSKFFKQFWQVINSLEEFNLTQQPSALIHKYKIEYDYQRQTANESNSVQANELNPYFAKLIGNQRMTSTDHWQNVRLLEFDCNTDRIKYEAGDVLVLRPSNLKQNVEKFLESFEHLNLDLNKQIKILSNFENEIQTETETTENLIQTIGDLVEKYFDLNSIPRMSFFEMLAELSNDEIEKEKLEEFLTVEGQEDLFNYCYRPRRTIVEIFYDFPKTCKSIKDLETLLDLIPSIKPRSFSIASSPKVHKNKIQLLVAVVEYKTRLYETRKGTCSYWLSTLDPNSNIEIPIWIKKGSFKINFEKPLICIGPGTGVAPFRSIINERIFKYDLEKNYLYFGCRSKSKDYYFESEWTDISNSNSNSLSVYAAFSRDQEDKIYVQDLMLKNADEVFKLIHEHESYVLIAGNSKRMPEDVLAILEKILVQNFAKSQPESNIEELAKNYIKELNTKKRIQLETWS